MASIAAGMASIAMALGAGAARLRRAGLASAMLDARVLLGEATGLDGARLIARDDEPLAAEAQARFAVLIERRLAGEPVARLLGRREFWGLPFTLSPATLVPRPESETIVAAALDRLRRAGRAGGPLRLLDLGTGSGCLLVALLRELPGALGLGIDRSPLAAASARANAAANGVGTRAVLAVGDWTAAPRGPFDVLVANPPYVASAEIGGLVPEVRDHDPWLALDGGADGLAAYRAITSGLAGLLAPGAVIAVEVGAGQARAVADLFAAAALAGVERVHDLSGIERVVAATR